MSFRTRLAFMVILLLLGCVFAAPFYHSTISPQAKSVESETSLPTLQIRRDAALPHVDEAKFEANTQSSFPTSTFTSTLKTDDQLAVSAISDNEPKAAHYVANRFESSRFNSKRQLGLPDHDDSLSVEPIPPLELPPAVSDSQKLKPIPVRTSSRNTNAADSAYSGSIPSGKIRSISSSGSRFHNNAATHRATKIAWNQQPGVDNQQSQRLAQRIDGHRPQQGTALQRIDRFSNQATAVPRQDQPNQPVELNQEKRWHRIARFDTLQELSKKYFGTDEFALHIFEANRESLVIPAILPIGTELIIPSTSAIRSGNRRTSRPAAQQLRGQPQPEPIERLQVEPLAPFGSVNRWRSRENEVGPINQYAAVSK